MFFMNTQLGVSQSIASYISSNPWIILLILWSLVWKLIALWKAARNGHMTVFIVLAILNTAGILEIAYIVYLYIKGKKKTETPEVKI